MKSHILDWHTTLASSGRMEGMSKCAIQRLTFLVGCLLTAGALTLGTAGLFVAAHRMPPVWTPLQQPLLYLTYLVFVLVPLLGGTSTAVGVACLFNRGIWFKIVGIPMGIGVGLVAGYASFVIIIFAFAGV